LDPAIRVETVPEATAITEPGAVLLTGATGFLGAFLLHELLRSTNADIYCLVRASDELKGMQRILDNLKAYKIGELEPNPRIIPVVGDLSEPLLGLDESRFTELAGRVDVIYHNGATVNFLYPYLTLKAANVNGTEEILRLAARGRVKPVHFISTVHVFGKGDFEEYGTIRENDEPIHWKDLKLGYTQSKWVAEEIIKLARSRGIPASIYRIGRISGDSRTGACQTNDFMWRLIKASMQIGFAPDVDMTVNFVPADFVSRAIVHLSKQSSLLGRDFHIINPNPLHLRDIFRWAREFGYQVELEPFKVWQEKLIEAAQHSVENAATDLLPILLETTDEEVKMRFDCSNTLSGLADSGIQCPPVDASLLTTYFTYFIETGFLAAP
jgi:thioester reductase-like protein